MHHRLLVAWQHEPQPAVLLQRLANTGHVAMAEDAETAGEQGPDVGQPNVGHGERRESLWQHSHEADAMPT